MFEREIKFIYDFNVNRINKIGSYLTFEQLVSSEIHPAILQYVSAEIDFLIFEDRQKLLHDSVFDYSGKEISGYFNLIDDEIKKSKKLSIAYIDKLLLHSISFIVNFLVRPRWTLSRFLFDKEESKSIAEVKQIIKYVYFYNYLTDTLVSYLDKKKLITVGQADVDSLIKKIDDFAIDSYLPNIIGTAVNSMSEFFSIGTIQQNTVPLNAVKLFLQEKDLDDHNKKLEDTFEHDEKTKFATSDVLNALSSSELIFNLKTMESEQIDEDEFKSEDLPEFEPIDADLNETEVSEDISEIDIENTNADNQNQASNLQNEDIRIKENTPEENNTDIVITEDEQSNNEPSQELFASAENENLVQVEAEDNSSIENSAEAEENSETKNERLDMDEAQADTEISELDEEDESEITVQDNDKFEFEKVAEEDEDLNVDSMDNPVENFQDDSSTEVEADLSESFISGIEEEQFEQETNLEEAISNVAEFEVEVLESEKSTEKEIISEDEILDDNEIDSVNDVLNNAVFGKSEDEDLSENMDELADESVEEPATEEVENIITEDESHENITEIIEEMESEIFEEELTTDNKTEFEESEELSGKSNDTNLSDIDDVEQPELFSQEELVPENTENIEDANSEEEGIQDEQHEPEEEAHAPQIELSELLENKNMNKILKVIFDYDMDDFVSAIDSISECKKEEDASKILESIYNTNGVKPTSKEAKIFNSIITEYFKKK